MNILRELESMTFQKDNDWDKHIEIFNFLVAKLASYDKPISLEDKVSKLLRPFPEHFAPISMVAESSLLSFEQVVASVKAEISRRKTTSSDRNIQPLGASAIEGGPSRRQSDHKRIQKNRRDLCFVCGRPGHFANKCWFRNDRPRERREFSRRGRGSGQGGRGSGRHHQSNFGNRSNPNFRSQKSASSWVIRQSQDNPPSQMAYGQQTENLSANIQSYGQNHNNGFDNTPFQGGFMAKIKFRTSIATSKDMNSFHCLIDSGATHHFFRLREAFLSYKNFPKQEALSASGPSIIVGKGEFKLQVNKGIVVEAYHAPHFTTNNLSVDLLSQKYDILFSSTTTESDTSCFCIISRQEDKSEVARISMEDGGFS